MNYLFLTKLGVIRYHWVMKNKTQARQAVRALKVGEKEKARLFKIIDSETDISKIKSAINGGGKKEDSEPKPWKAPENKKIESFEGK